MKIPAYLRQTWKGLKKRGWSFGITGGDHVVLTSPRGRKVFASLTPSDWRAHKHVAAKCRRVEREENDHAIREHSC